MKKSNNSISKVPQVNTAVISSGKPLEKMYAGHKLGILISMGVSVLSILVLALVKMITISGNQFMNVLGIDIAEKGVSTKYFFYTILSMVKKSGQGKLGLYSMALLVLGVVVVYFQVSFLIKALRTKQNNISTYETGQMATFFTVALSIALAYYGTFTDNKLGMSQGISVSPIVYLLIVLNIASFVVIKLIEAPERRYFKQHGFFHELRKNWVLFVMLIPTILYFALNAYLPMVGVYFAFESFNFKDGLWNSPFVGFANFKHIFKADLFLLTKNTILYNIVFIFLGNILQIFSAILVSQIASKWFKRVSQTLMFMPYFVSFVILNVLVYNLLNYEMGVVNNLVTKWGMNPIDFYNKPNMWPVLITIFYIWKNIGYGMVVYLATILGISKEYYEAAEVDGANVFQQIRYITLPQIKPTFVILLLFALGGIMKGQFELFYQMVGNNGVLFHTTDIFDTYVYRITMTNPMSNGIGTAAGLYQSIFGFILIMLVNFFVKKKNPDYALF